MANFAASAWSSQSAQAHTRALLIHRTLLHAVTQYSVAFVWTMVLAALNMSLYAFPLASSAAIIECVCMQNEMQATGS